MCSFPSSSSLNPSPIPPLHRSVPLWCWSTAAWLKVFGGWGRRLSVNGRVRQDLVVEGDILYPPVQALQALSRFQKLDAGDILLTGTPVGTALTLHGKTPKGDMDLGAFLTAQFEKNPA